MRRGKRCAAAAVVVVSLAAAAMGAEDWPKWLGPRGDGISRDAVSSDWPDGGPRQLWSATVGIGHSSPVVAGGKVYLFHLLGDRDTLHCSLPLTAS